MRTTTTLTTGDGFNGFASLIDHVFVSSGPFVTRVGGFGSSGNVGGIAGAAPTDDYTLHVSFENHILATGTGAVSEVSVLNKVLESNDGSGTEFLIDHTGSVGSSNTSVTIP